jgi:hypothetical protein
VSATPAPSATTRTIKSVAAFTIPATPPRHRRRY